MVRAMKRVVILLLGILVAVVGLIQTLQAQATTYEDKGAFLLWEYPSETEISVIPIGDDYNGDGIGDFIVMEKYDAYCRLVKISGSSGNVLGISENITGANASWFVKDFNADGYKDVLVVTENGNLLNLIVISCEDLSIINSTSFVVPFNIRYHDTAEISGEYIGIFTQTYEEESSNLYTIRLNVVVCNSNLQVIWSKNMSTQMYYYVNFYSYVIAEDSNSDGTNEIYLFEPSSDITGMQTTIYILSGADGSVLHTATLTGMSIFISVLVQDIDSDSMDEILISTFNFVGYTLSYKLYAYEEDLTEITSMDLNGLAVYPICIAEHMIIMQSQSGGYAYMSPLPMKVADVNNDGKCDAIFVEYDLMQQNPTIEFRAIDLYGSTQIWSTTVKNNSLAVCYPRDVDGNGMEDYPLVRCYNDITDIYMISAENGNIIWNKTYPGYEPSEGLFMVSMDYGDVNGDSLPDLPLTRVAKESTGSIGGITVLSASNGSEIWTNTTNLPAANYSSDSYFIGDINGDGVTEICLAYSTGDDNCNAYILVYSGSSGELLWYHQTQSDVNMVTGTDLLSEVTGANYDVNANSLSDEFIVVYNDTLSFYIYQPGNVPEISLVTIVPLGVIPVIIRKLS